MNDGRSDTTMVENTETRNAFKDWFDERAAAAIAKQIKAAHRQFNQPKFVQLATRKLTDLEFHGRVQQFSAALRETLPQSPAKSLRILTDSLPDILPNCDAVTDGWLQWPIGHFVATHGLDHFDESMELMIELTKRFTSEFAVRPFVERYPDQTFARLTKLTADKNAHVRRWCSEGVRPRLPWGKKLTSLVKDPSPIWPIVEALKDDPELYVRRSVANNLNDIAKDHPAAVVARCELWSQQATHDRRRTVRHALRSLVKAGDPGALAVLGFKQAQRIGVELAIQPRSIQVGEQVQLTVNISTTANVSQRLLVDYIVHFVRKGGRTNAKVFKWKSLELGPRTHVTLTKRHPMKTTSVRALYPGMHRVEVQINGALVAESEFKLRL